LGFWVWGLGQTPQSPIPQSPHIKKNDFNFNKLKNNNKILFLKNKQKHDAVK
jgi:hypothetical protein